MTSLLNIASPVPASEAERALSRLKVRIAEYLRNHPWAQLEQIDSLHEGKHFFLIACFSDSEEFAESYVPESGTRMLRIRIRPTVEVIA
jgi:hypothetical protein